MNKNRDKRIDTILERAFEYNKKCESEKYCELLKRAWNRVKENMKKESINSIIEYDEKYETLSFVSNWIQDISMVLYDIYQDTGKKEFLNEQIDFIDEVLSYKCDEFVSEVLLIDKKETISELERINNLSKNKNM